MTKQTQLTPPDPARCQALVRPAHGPFVLGPRPDYERCRNAPVVIAVEVRPGPDGQRGAMSLCAECKAAFDGQMPEGLVRFEEIEKEEAS